MPLIFKSACPTSLNYLTTFWTQLSKKWQNGIFSERLIPTHVLYRLSEGGCIWLRGTINTDYSFTREFYKKIFSNASLIIDEYSTFNDLRGFSLKTRTFWIIYWRCFGPFKTNTPYWSLKSVFLRLLSKNCSSETVWNSTNSNSLRHILAKLARSFSSYAPGWQSTDLLKSPSIARPLWIKTFLALMSPWTTPISISWRKPYNRSMVICKA